MRQRRDPRGERQARLIAGTTRPRFVLAPVTPQISPARRRRDPRTKRRAATVVAGIRPRIDWRSGLAGAATAIPHGKPSESANIEPQVRIIADPAFLVLVVPDLPDGVPSDHDRQLIGAGRQFADAGGGGAVVVLTAGEIGGLDKAGADRGIAVPTGPLEYDPEGRAAAVLAAIDRLKPRHVLFPESAEGGADLARRVAALAGERLFSGVETISPDRVSRRSRGGAEEMAARPPFLMSIAENAAAEHHGAAHEARRLEAPEPPPMSRKIASASPLAVEADRLPLADADFILSAGNGVTDWQSFAELAQTLGATPGGSRVVCDEGHLPRDRQVGASGSIVTARCYLAFGIAGAPQHLQGIAEVKHVVAINTDLHAEMIKRADLAIIADAQAVMPALILHAKERRNG
jgi:electron transfer flavoprotein alpha subunit